MKALVSHAAGGPETLALAELPDPIAKPGEIIVDVRACAVNYPDVLIIEDRYQLRPERPFAPGAEVAGVISAVGEGVANWSVGDRVIAASGFGGMVEKIAIPADSAFALPEGVGFDVGASLLLTYGTTIHALVDRGRIKAGETLLVLGAAGGVGLAAIELGKAYGARVIAAVSSEDKALIARETGADATLVYPRAPFDKAQSKALADAFKAAVGPEGADIIYDAVGGDYAEPALRSIAWEGRYLVIGFPAGIPSLPLNLTLLKSCDVRGVFWGAFTRRDPAANAAHVATLFDLLRRGLIAPRVTGHFPLAEGGAAIARLASRQSVGKLVVTIGE